MGTTPLLHKSHSLGSLQSAAGSDHSQLGSVTGSPAKLRRSTLIAAHRSRLFLAAATLFLLAIVSLAIFLLSSLLDASDQLDSAAAISIRHRHSGGARGGRQSAAAAAQPPAGRRRFAAVTLDVRQQPLVALAGDSERAGPRQANCSHWDCFDVYRCGHGRVAERMAVYVYPLRRYVDAASGAPAAELSREWLRVLRAVRESRYYTADPREACVFVPSVDLLNENRVDGEVAARALAAMEYWDTGDNHLLFNMVPGTAPHYNRSLDVPTDRAMIAGAGFDTWTYRYGFDLAIPFYMAGLSDAHIPQPESATPRPFLLIAAQLNLYARHTRILQELAYDHQAEVLLLQECADFGAESHTPKPGAERSSASSGTHNQPAAAPEDWRCAFPEAQQRHSYPAVLAAGRFCLVMRGQRLVALNLLETMAAGCVPVVVADNLVLPFAEILDWTLAVVQVRESNLHSLVTRLQAISEQRVTEMSRQVRWLHARYFGSLERMVATVLDQLNERIFPHLARDQRAWNQERGAPLAVSNPLFLAQTAARAPGFTAVILTYDRVESLYTLIEKLSVVGSLHKVLVVWNNQRKAPPHINQFPKIAKPLQLIRTTANKLSNRFYPYEDIETEAILTIDDDIVMLTADELDFGYEVWREFPDRIVGFPSRTHVWDNGTGRWRYESEWTNEISMVLTGAAFHHKYWSHMYTTAMPGDIKQWVDEHMNCEDIAMNFLVANITGQPPIKVAPRKKFKCPECINTEMLSADLNHMMERSACIDRFSRIYGRMPLRTIEFRADPVLYKDQFPEKLKRFNDIGSL